MRRFAVSSIEKYPWAAGVETLARGDRGDPVLNGEFRRGYGDWPYGHLMRPRIERTDWLGSLFVAARSVGPLLDTGP